MSGAGSATRGLPRVHAEQEPHLDVGKQSAGWVQPLSWLASSANPFEQCENSKFLGETGAQALPSLVVRRSLKVCASTASLCNCDCETKFFTRSWIHLLGAPAHWSNYPTSPSRSTSDPSLTRLSLRCMGRQGSRSLLGCKFPVF